MAHNVHPDRRRAGAAGRGRTRRSRIVPAATPRSAAACFPLRRHVDAGVTCALGTDVGGGIGFGMLKEGLQAYLMQRLAARRLVARCGAPAVSGHARRREALGLDNEIGDFARQGGRLRLPASARRTAVRRPVLQRATPGAGAGGDLHAGGCRERSRSRVDGQVVLPADEPRPAGARRPTGRELVTLTD